MNPSALVLTPQKKKIVEELKYHLKHNRKRTEPFICDYFVFRFLEARKWKPEKARQMLENYFAFRDRMMKKAGELRTRKGSITQRTSSRRGGTPSKARTTRPTRGRRFN